MLSDIFNLFRDNLAILAPLLLVGIITFVVIPAWLLKRKRKKGAINRGLNLSLLIVALPQAIEKEEREKKIALEEYLKTAEQFYTALSGVKEKSKFKSWVLRNPSIVFELAVNRIGEEIYFYVAVPRTLEEMAEKQILGFWPKAQIQKAPDYNIFNPQGVSLGAEALLKMPAILPLKSSQEFKTDPLSPLTSILTKLTDETEGASIQVVFRPAKQNLRKQANVLMEALQKGMKVNEALMQAGFSVGFVGFAQKVLKLFEKKDKPELPRGEVTPTQKEIVELVSHKVGQPLFEVNLRLLCSSASQVRTEMILNQMEQVFSQFNSPITNQLVFKKPKSKKSLKNLFYNFSFRLFNEQKAMLLSSGELASLFHFPLGVVLTPHIKWLKAKQAAPPENLPQTGLLIGKSVFRAEERPVRMMKEDRGRHLYVLGQTGTGKSAFLSELIRQDMENGEGLALIDPHGELAEKVLATVPANRAEDVIYFDPTDPEKALGLNMLDFNPRFPESKTLVTNELLEIFEKLYNLQAHGFGGPIFEQYMRNSLLLVMEHPESGSTLIEVPRVLSDVKFRKFKLAHCQNIVVKNFWEQEAEKAGGEASLANMVPYITSKMNIFIANDLVRPIIAQQKSAFDFRQIMDESKILIVNLSKGRLGDINSYLLGMITVGKLLIAALSRADVPEEKRKDFNLYIDEFHNVTTKTIATGLAEARKYHLNLILAHQFIAQLEEPIQKAVFGNVGSMLVFRVGADDAKYLVTQFGPTFDEQDLVNFDNFNGALRLLIRGETSKPFNIATYPPQKSDNEIAQIVKELSRLKFGKNRVNIENELAERLQKVF